MGTQHSARNHSSSRENGGVKKKKPTTKKMPELTKNELLHNLPKSEAVLLRLTVADKETITQTASKLGITTTELLTKTALMVAEKLKK